MLPKDTARAPMKRTIVTRKSPQQKRKGKRTAKAAFPPVVLWASFRPIIVTVITHNPAMGMPQKGIIRKIKGETPYARTRKVASKPANAPRAKSRKR